MRGLKGDANGAKQDIAVFNTPEGGWVTFYGTSASDNVMAWHRPFPHNYNQVSRELMYGWMNTHLKLGQSEPVQEKPFVPVPPAELTVYDAAHPQPADTADAAGVRKEMTRVSD